MAYARFRTVEGDCVRIQLGSSVVGLSQDATMLRGPNRPFRDQQLSKDSRLGESSNDDALGLNTINVSEKDQTI